MKNTNINDVDTLTSNSHDVSIQKTEVSHNLFIMMFALFLFLIIEVLGGIWIISYVNKINEDFKRDVMAQLDAYNSWRKDINDQISYLIRR